MEETAHVEEQPAPTEMTFKRSVIDKKRIYEFTATAMPDGRTALCIRSGPSDATDLHELSGIIAREDLAAVAAAFKPELTTIAAWHGIDIDKHARYSAVRARHPNAYLFWKESDDERLLQLHEAGVPVRDIAKQLGRQIGAINRRLERHGIHV